MTPAELESMFDSPSAIKAAPKQAKATCPVCNASDLGRGQSVCSGCYGKFQRKRAEQGKFWQGQYEDLRELHLDSADRHDAALDANMGLIDTAEDRISELRGSTAAVAVVCLGVGALIGYLLGRLSR